MNIHIPGNSQLQELESGTFQWQERHKTIPQPRKGRGRWFWRKESRGWVPELRQREESHRDFLEGIINTSSQPTGCPYCRSHTTQFVTALNLVLSPPTETQVFKNTSGFRPRLTSLSTRKTYLCTWKKKICGERGNYRRHLSTSVYWWCEWWRFKSSDWKWRGREEKKPQRSELCRFRRTTVNAFKGHGWFSAAKHRGWHGTWSGAP